MQGRNTMKTNDAMVDYLIRIGALHSDPIIEAFRHVDRADFVGDAASFEIYEDHPLHIGGDQTISQPQTVAMMLEMLSPSSGQKILDIGSGSRTQKHLRHKRVRDQKSHRSSGSLCGWDEY